MSLAAGSGLGPYEIASLIGEGGMGEVYKARDTRLDRTVAIKILPPELSAHPDRRARFEREARAVAALSHPHICTLYDIGEAVPSSPEPRASGLGREPALSEPRERRVEGRAPSPRPPAPVHYLVMEHLQGDSLADRLRRGPLPLAQALELGAQIADALDAAHKHGIIHRDLKPGNVMLTTGGAGRSGVTVAKLLDFGLAKLAAHGERPALAADASAPTEAAPVTAEGTILGTLQYMAPEQLEGKEADARTDLWALGAILHEMVTGKRVFEGESQVSLIGNIMNAEPPALSTLQPLTPPSLERVVKKCLAKHADDRWDTAHDVADELRWVAQTSGATPAAPPTRERRRWVPLALAATLAAGLLLGAAITWTARAPRSAPTVALARVNLDVLPAEELNAGGVSTVFLPLPGSRRVFDWTPDGEALVFVSRRAGVQQIYVRRLDADEARPLAGTEGAQAPVVSPDGQWVAFWAAGALRKVPLGGGPVMDLAPVQPVPPFGLAWDDGGALYWGHADGRIWRIGPDGASAAVTAVGDAEQRHSLPVVLPGGSTLMYTVRRQLWTWGDDQVAAHVLATGERKVLLQDAADVRYLPTGHLVFMRRGTLFAVGFDARRLEVRGTPVALLDRVVQALTTGNSADTIGTGQFAVSSRGTAAVVRGPVTLYRAGALVTVSLDGRVTPLPAPERPMAPAVDVSPDGRRIAATIRELTASRLWIYEIRRGTLTILPGAGEAYWPRWSPDGRRVAFKALAEGRSLLALQDADGLAPMKPVLTGVFDPSSWTPDGLQLLGLQSGDIAVATIDDGRASVKPLIETPNEERWPELSPDGRWLAYGSDMTGRYEIYVRPFPGPGRAEQVSIDGGTNVAWHPSGRELFFVGPSASPGRRSMLAAAVAPGPRVQVGVPRTLFEFDPADLRLACEPNRCYDVAPDGQRFYATQTRPSPPQQPITHISLMTNFFELLKEKVPAR